MNRYRLKKRPEILIAEEYTVGLENGFYREWTPDPIAREWFKAGTVVHGFEFGVDEEGKHYKKVQVSVPFIDTPKGKRYIRPGDYLIAETEMNLEKREWSGLCRGEFLEDEYEAVYDVD